MQTSEKENFSRVKYIEQKFQEWFAYYQKFGMEPVRVYISRNWFDEMIDEAKTKINGSIFTERIFNNRQGVRVYNGLPLILVHDSNYFQVEGTIREEFLPKVTCTSLTWNATNRIVNP